MNFECTAMDVGAPGLKSGFLAFRRNCPHTFRLEHPSKPRAVQANWHATFSVITSKGSVFSIPGIFVTKHETSQQANKPRAYALPHQTVQWTL
jgi:hypothetical protein